MKIEKVLFFLTEALRLAAVRCDCERLSQTELTILYIVRNYGHIREESILRKFASFYHPIARNTVSVSLRKMFDNNLVSRSNGYTITPLGREYLAYVRRYMINRRL